MLMSTYFTHLLALSSVALVFSQEGAVLFLLLKVLETIHCGHRHNTLYMLVIQTRCQWSVQELHLYVSSYDFCLFNVLLYIKSGKTIHPGARIWFTNMILDG